MNDRSEERGLRIARLSLGIVAAAFAFYLWLGPHPWECGIQARLARGGPQSALRVRDYAVSGLWYAALVNCVLAVLLCASARFWARSIPPPAAAAAPRPHRRFSARFWVALGAVVVAAAWIRLPLLRHSLWNDEEYALRRYVWGYLEGSPDIGAPLMFHPVDWSTTFFRNRGANNHLLFSVIARLGLAGWRGLTGASPERFDEGALRAPSLLAGLGAVAALGVLVGGIGGEIAGIGAGCLLALHPWHVRFSAEAKGYSLLLCLALLSCLALRRALADPRWRWWLLFALCQALALLSFPGAVHFAGAQAACAAAAIWMERRGPGRAWVRLGRLGASELFAAMLVLQWMGPSIPQIRTHLGRAIARGTMGADWWRDLGSHLAIGLPHINQGTPGSHLGTGFSALAQAHAPWVTLAAGLLAVLVVLGAFRLTRLGPGAFAALAPFVFGPLCAYAHTMCAGNLLYSWYLLYSLPGLIALAALGADWPAGALRGQRPRAAARAGAAALVAAVFAWLAATPLAIVRAVPRQPMREAAALARSGPDAARALTCAFGTSNEQMRTYDPRVQLVEVRADLDALIARARRERRPLYVLYAGRARAEREQRDTLALADDPALFIEAGRVLGWEEMFSYRVLRLRSGDG